ncbi:MAG: helix-turn-helix transcriptional regulator [Alphaproteobacteria bacterium]|nr:helix-turn-helix transcriptional regulator [Alphaproteobacteria bacterium]
MTSKDPRTTPLDKIIGEVAKNYRKSRDLSQSKIADLLGLTTGQISLMENGKRAWMVLYIYQLAEFYGVDPVTFLGGLKIPADQLKLFALMQDRLAIEKEITSIETSLKTKSASQE